jgi:hypothetical protein
VSVWFRLGPIGLSSRGRVGVRAGPVSVYGGGRRSRKSSGGGGIAVLFLILVVIGLVVTYWYVAVPLIVVLLIVGVVVASGSQDRARKRHEEWLAAPPPPFIAPSRFTEKWIASNVPALHPGQVPDLLASLRSRGWSDENVGRRVVPHLPPMPATAPQTVQEAPDTKNQHPGDTGDHRVLCEACGRVNDPVRRCRTCGADL